MPRVTLMQTNFTAGELSPRILGRVDIAKYANGAKTIINAFPQVQGGVAYRWGTRFMGEIKDSSSKARLIPFVFSRTQSYMLEAGNNYFRYYAPEGLILDGGLPYETATPYTSSQAFEVDYVQSADTMFVAHQSYWTRRLRRFGETRWNIDEAPFSPGAFDEIGIRPNAVLTLSATTVGIGRTATAASGVFMASDVGRTFTYESGHAEITGYTSSTVVTCEIKTAFPATNLANGSWILEGSPYTVCTPSAKDPLESVITLTLAAAGWRAGDVGRHVRINGGLVQITSLDGTNPDTIANGKIKRALNATVGAEPLSWSLNDFVWNSNDGYPRTVSLYEQRLFAAGSTRFPQTIWGSAIGRTLDFTPGTNDDDACTFPIGADQFNPITYLSSGRSLMALSTGGENTLDGGLEKAIAQLNVQVKFRTNHGTANVRPVRVFKDEAYVQRAGKKIRLFGYNGSTDDWESPDITKLSDHLFQAGIVDLAFVQEPEPILFALRSDGVLLSATIDRDEGVIAWARQVTDGEIESIASMPVDEGEQLWCVVKRTINGQTKRYVEVFDPTIAVDSGIFGINEDGAATWAGLGHLEGKSVSVLADGVPMGEFVVTGGEITLPRDAHEVMIGLPYELDVVVLTPELQTGTGTAQSNAMSISEVWIKVINSIGCLVDGQPIEFRKLDESKLDEAVAEFDGFKKVGKLGWKNGIAETRIQHSQPLPFTLLSVIRKLTVND